MPLKEASKKLLINLLLLYLYILQQHNLLIEEALVEAEIKVLYA